MAHEADIQARLKRLVAQTYGAEAELALRHLSMFLNERFGGAAIKVFAPRHPDHYIQTADYLFGRKFIHKISNVKGQYEIWKEKHWPWDNNNYYWIEPEVIQHYHPAPTEDERIFAAYAAFIFTHSGGVSKKTFEIYLRLMDWAQEHKPDIAVVFAQQVVKRYGGSDARLHEKLYEIAGLRGLVGEQAQTIWQLGEVALHENNSVLAVERCHQVLAVGNPETDSAVAYPHVRVLEILGHMAEDAEQWAEARAFYERSLFLRDRVLRDHKPYVPLLIALRRVTRLQGDTMASAEYAKRMKRLPEYLLRHITLD